MKQKPIYVENKIKTDMESLWEKTQAPDQHEQWDLRFSSITYLKKESDDDPQRFLYTTNIGFGLKISGEGESKGTREGNSGERTSSLKFWSDQPISLISNGSGYWKYVPKEGEIQFLTWYDYKTRFGFFGSVLDRFVFRPIMGWGTAWSFDCLRLWLEKGIAPAISIKRNLLQFVSLLILSFIWIYHGLLPKILFKDSGELEILRNTGLFHGSEAIVLTFIGVLEIIFGLSFWLVRNKRRMYLLNVFLLILLGVGAAVSQPEILVAPFNPVSVTAAMIGLSFTGLLSLKDIPSAANCLRRPSE